MCLNREQHQFFISNNKVKLHYVIWQGLRDDTPIVCVHGLTSNCRYFCALAEELTKERNVYSYDLRGRGYSDKPTCGYGITFYAADLNNFLTWLNLPAVHLLGHSFGAAIIAYYLAHYPAKPVEKVILVEGGTDYPPNFREQIQPSLDRLGVCYLSLDHFWETMKKVPYYNPWSNYYERYLIHDIDIKPNGWVIPRTPKMVVLEDLASIATLKLIDLLPQVNKETMILRATRGFRYPRDYILSTQTAKQMLKKLPRGILVDVPHTHHISIVLGKAAYSAQFIKKFLQNVTIHRGSMVVS